MAAALVIGASRGIGREFVRQLLQDGWQVFATARDDASLAALGDAGAQGIRLDVAQTDSVATLGGQLDGACLDLVLYVAGVYGPEHGADTAPTRAAFDQVMQANVLGAMQLIPTIAPMAAGGKCIFISSGMGSIAGTTTSTGWVYRASKAALNMAVKSAASAYPSAVLAVMSPGWVQTDMGGPDASISVQQSVDSMRSVIARLGLQDSGGFYNYNGARLPW